jgi:hypothetical protein
MTFPDHNRSVLQLPRRFERGTILSVTVMNQAGDELNLLARVEHIQLRERSQRQHLCRFLQQVTPEDLDTLV